MLRCDRLGIRFDGFAALSEVSLELDPGSTHAVIGPNGAGKSTLFNLISGHLKPDSGSVTLAGEPISGLPPHRIARRGLARSFQRINVFPRLTVAANVEVALLARDGRHFTWHSFGDRPHPEVEHLLGLVGLEGEVESVAGSMSYGRQKQLELAIALASRPRLLVLDEPTTGMSPAETEAAMELLQRIKGELGLTLLFSEHDMAVVFGIADIVFVLHHGELIASGPPPAVRAHERVRRVYLGEVDDAGS